MRAGTLLPAAALVLSLAAPAAGAPADLAAIRDLLRRGDRSRALEASRAAVSEDPDGVDAHLLYQDAARGQVPVNALLAEYRGRYEKSPGGDAAYLYSRLLPPSDAERLLRDAVKADPKSYWLQVGMSNALARSGRGAPAEQAALAALDLRPGDATAAVRAGDQCSAARRFPAAEACYRRAVEANAADANARMGLALALVRQRKFDEADAALKGLRGGAKPDPRVLLLDAALAAERGDAASAEKALVQATSLSPNDQDAVVQLALLRLKRAGSAPRPPGRAVDPRSVAGEAAALEKAAGLLPERADIRYALGYCHEITGDPDRALEDYREASRLDPLDGDVIVAAGSILVNRGQMEEAVKEFQRALDRSPEDTDAMFLLGFALDQQAKVKEAVPVYQKLVKTDPGNARGWHALGMALEATGKPRDAAAAFQKAVDLDPKTARFLRDLGEALYGNKAFEKAEEALAKAAALDPKDDTAWTGLARSRTQCRRYAEGAEAYEKAAELRPKDQDIQLLLGAYYHEFLKDYEKAIAHYNKYVALGGDAADVEDWLAEAQAELDRKKK